MEPSVGELSSLALPCALATNFPDHDALTKTCTLVQLFPVLGAILRGSARYRAAHQRIVCAWRSSRLLRGCAKGMGAMLFGERARKRERASLVRDDTRFSSAPFCWRSPYGHRIGGARQNTTPPQPTATPTITSLQPDEWRSGTSISVTGTKFERRDFGFDWRSPATTFAGGERDKRDGTYRSAAVTGKFRL